MKRPRVRTIAITAFLLGAMIVALRLAAAVSRAPATPLPAGKSVLAAAPTVVPLGDAEACEPIGVIVPRESVDVAPRIPGRLRAVHVQLGQRVARGTRLASVDATPQRADRAIARAAVRGALAQERRAAVDLEQATRRLAQTRVLADSRVHAVSADDLARAQADLALARAALDSARARTAEQRAQVARLGTDITAAELVAPFDGVVAARHASPGAYVAAGAPVVRIVASGELWVRFAVAEERVGALSVGKPVTVLLPDGERGAATIEHVAPELDTAARLFLVEARLAPSFESNPAVRAGLAVRVALACVAPARVQR